MLSPAPPPPGADHGRHLCHVGRVRAGPVQRVDLAGTPTHRPGEEERQIIKREKILWVQKFFVKKIFDSNA